MRRLILVSATLATLGGAAIASSPALAQLRVNVQELERQNPAAAQRWKGAESRARSVWSRPPVPSSMNDIRAQFLRPLKRPKSAYVGRHRKGAYVGRHRRR